MPTRLYMVACGQNSLRLNLTRVEGGSIKMWVSNWKDSRAGNSSTLKTDTVFKPLELNCQHGQLKIQFNFLHLLFICVHAHARIPAHTYTWAMAHMWMSEDKLWEVGFLAFHHTISIPAGPTDQTQVTRLGRKPLPDEPSYHTTTWDVEKSQN